jgi:hypothetical protein
MIATALAAIAAIALQSSSRTMSTANGTSG